MNCDINGVLPWTKPDAVETLHDAALAGGAAALSGAIENETRRQRFAELELQATFGTAPTAGALVTVYYVGSVDGTNYEDGNASVTSLTTPVAYFSMRAVTTGQRQRQRVSLPPINGQFLIKNTTGKSASAMILRARLYS